MNKLGKLLLLGGVMGTGLVMTKGAFANEAINMYRLYNPNSGEHFYTGNVQEKADLQNIGWKYEGIGWYAPTTGNDVYRLYNPNNGDHHYTLSRSERDNLIQIGWRYEGVGWQSSTNQEVPLYRVYNPNNKGAGSHHYTTAFEEIAQLIRLGWNDEGIGWYGIMKNNSTNSNQVAKDLTQAKIEALAKLSSMNLTSEQKAEYTTKINTSQKKVEVIDIITKAQTQEKLNNAQNETAKELARAKIDALATLDTMHITSEQKAEFTTEIKAAKAKSEITGILAKAQVQEQVNNNQNETAKALDQAKVNALSKLSAMSLTSEQKNEYTNEINNSKTQEEVATTLTKAQNQANQNTTASEQSAKALTQAKSEAVTTINSLRLGKSIKNKYVSQVNSATTKDQVSTIVKSAQDKANGPKSFEELREEAADEVLNMNLDPYQKASYYQKLKACTSEQELSTIVNYVKKVEAAQGATGDVFLKLALEEFDRNIQAERKSLGLSKIENSSELNSLAAIRSKELVEKFDHTRPDGSAWLTVANKSNYQLNGECITSFSVRQNNPIEAGKEAFNMWKKSSGHYAIMMEDSPYYGVSFKESNVNIYAVFITGEKR